MTPRRNDQKRNTGNYKSNTTATIKERREIYTSEKGSPLSLSGVAKHFFTMEQSLLATIDIACKPNLPDLCPMKQIGQTDHLLVGQLGGLLIFKIKSRVKMLDPPKLTVSSLI